ncbi:MAG: DUF3108 domain-containing protein [Opitutaceae bacterium]|nr:DUF3108 domain-containing protein [Opitutaceae bacterium]
MRLRPALLALLMTSLPALSAEVLALRDGEKFTFKVSWAILPGAGEIKIAVENDPAFNEPRLRVVTTTATRGFTRMVLAFDARAESLFDPGSGRLVSLREWSQNRDKSNDHTVLFDYAKKEALYTRAGVPAPRTLALPPGDPMDLITQLVQTRGWNLKPGEKRDALVLFDDDFYELTIHAARLETVKSALGTFQALVLEPRMEKTAPKGMFKRGASARVWIAQDDPRRLPVKFEVEFKVGRGVATLTHYEPPKAGDAKNPGP